MKSFRKICCLFIALIFLGLCSACSQSVYNINLLAFNSPCYIELYGKAPSSELENEISSLIDMLEEQFDIKNTQSLPYKLKNASIGQAVTLTPTQNEVLSLAKQYNTYTNGKFNPLTYPLSELWGFKGEAKTTPPAKEEIENVLNSGAVDINNIVIENNTITKLSDCVLDFGGLLKGYASQKIAELIKNDGYRSGYVNIGSSSLTLMYIPYLSIVHPRKANENIITVHLVDKDYVNVSTSGDYEKYFDYDGVRYSHLIDPTTGESSKTNILSATLLGNSGVFCDALTTAICLTDYDPAHPMENDLATLLLNIMSDYPDCSFYIVYNDGYYKHVLTNKKQGQHFSLLDNEYRVVKFSL